MPPLYALDTAASTDPGRRSDNEDSFFAGPRLAVVADGVGGAAAGEVASRLVVNAFIALEKRWVDDDLDLALSAAAADANRAVELMARARPAWRGLASTLTALAVADDGRYVVAQVGDSRAYLSRHGSLTQLTADESLVGRYVAEGLITEQQARIHPQRNIVLRAVDGEVDRVPAIRRLRARPGDRLLLCSDGVSDVLDDVTIATHLAEGAPGVAARALTGAALEAGSRDNVTAVVADVWAAPSNAIGWRRTH